MISGCQESIRQSLKYLTLTNFMDFLLLAVHQLFCIGDGTSKCFTDGLMPKADTQDRQPVFEIFYGFNADSRIFRTPRARRKDQWLPVSYPPSPVWCTSSFRTTLISGSTEPISWYNIIGKAVIIIDQYYHSSPSCAVSIACTTALALLQHSWNSFSGTLSATIPAPDRMQISPFFL